MLFDINPIASLRTGVTHKVEKLVKPPTPTKTREHDAARK